ncbi:MAG: hypothetical protein RIQ68_1465, partial [Pseudomonadota bacterium]
MADHALWRDAFLRKGRNHRGHALGIFGWREFMPKGVKPTRHA